MVTRDIDVLARTGSFQIGSCYAFDYQFESRSSFQRWSPGPLPLQNRLKAVKALSDAGIPVGVNVAPVIPGLTDSEIPEILKQAADHGAKSAAYIIMRLPYAVKELFEEWVRRELPDRAEKILNRIREVRGGNLSDPTVSFTNDR